MISMFCARRGASTRCRPWLAAREEAASSRACCSFSAAAAAAFLAAPFGSLGFSAKRSESSLSLASSSSPPPANSPLRPSRAQIESARIPATHSKRLQQYNREQASRLARLSRPVAPRSG